MAPDDGDKKDYKEEKTQNNSDKENDDPNNVNISYMKEEKV